MATIYQCMYRGQSVTSSCGSANQGKRPKCRGCKSDVRQITGRAVTIAHRGDGRYHVVDAVKEYATMAAAEKAAQLAYEADNNSALVARFLV